MCRWGYRCLALRTRGGRLKITFVLWELFLLTYMLQYKPKKTDVFVLLRSILIALVLLPFHVECTITYIAI